MGTTTMGVKLDDATRERIKSAATRIDRTPHWLIKQAIFSYLEQLENSDTLPELPALLSGAANESDEAPTPAEEPHQPFLDFAEQILPQSVSRAAITAAYRRPEPKRFLCCWNKPACRSQLLNRRTNWRINWPINCVIKKTPVVAQVWFRGYCRSFRCHRRKAWR
ncbi:trifunctional transcriptional regulator/proline dehydrogenase/pyrroline-5-carboxylate dehydrogenase [Escherichia coli]|uniref:Trifunctional transcriptional regulator/proline dehydrogenase/pyrroline-5-carboxylate dehydrogenase n=1 Tax=Escherichia coli TaxID=562 RepID=A0A376TI94_ECOLX|nr:trifunctional transcriptional regulator/proline dehydrogenase/pyrroline-5-carboxylate dehydrogenase [Escherichia coli]